MKWVFIVNKNAGKGKSNRILPNIEKACKARNIEYEIRLVTPEKTGYEIALEYKDDECVIYAVGGDGTLTWMLPALVGTKNKLGLIPAGSGNDTYKTIKKMDSGEYEIDIGKINDKYFINVACSGIDAEVAGNIDKFRKTIVPSSQLYNVSVIYTFFKFKPKKIKIKTETKEIDAEYTIFSICNGSYYGGGYNIGPKSSMTDGMLEIYFAEKMPKLSMVPLILKVKKGKHEGNVRIHKYRTTHVEVEFEEDTLFNVDGEQMKDKKFVIDLLPKKIILHNDKEFVEEVMKKK